MSIIDDLDEREIAPLLNPLKGFEELQDILDPASGRLLGKFGVPGMKIEDASRLAEVWWDRKARHMMPDVRKPDAYLNKFGIKSGIINGLPWASLDRGERIAVVKNWHEHIGIPLHGMGFNNTDTKGFENEIRKFDLSRIFGSPLAKA